MADFAPLEGGCACGQIRYRLTGLPLVVACCHCTFCQRITGSAFHISIVTYATDVEFLPPAPPMVPGRKGLPEMSPAGPAPAAVKLSESGIGEPTHFMIPNERGNGFTTSSCGSCGVAVWMTFGSPSEVGMNSSVLTFRGGTLDTPWELPVDAHLFTRSKRDFITLPTEEEGGVPQFEAFYPYTSAEDPAVPPRLIRFMQLVDGFNKMLAEQAKAGGGEGDKKLTPL